MYNLCYATESSCAVHYLGNEGRYICAIEKAGGHSSFKSSIITTSCNVSENPVPFGKKWTSRSISKSTFSGRQKPMCSYKKRIFLSVYSCYLRCCGVPHLRYTIALKAFPCGRREHYKGFRSQVFPFKLSVLNLHNTTQNHCNIGCHISMYHPIFH